jgi:tRNA(fMet)-specific endonuclease VapC
VAFLIDTNIAIHARDGDERVLNRLAEHDGAVFLSALSLAELQRGFARHPATAALRRLRLDTLLGAIPVLPFDAEAAVIYGQIIAHCGWVKGRDFDRMIAAHAVRSRLTLVTLNRSDFRDIPGLALADWTD